MYLYIYIFMYVCIYQHTGLYSRKTKWLISEMTLSSLCLTRSSLHTDCFNSLPKLYLFIYLFIYLLLKTILESRSIS